MHSKFALASKQYSGIFAPIWKSEQRTVKWRTKCTHFHTSAYQHLYVPFNIWMHVYYMPLVVCVLCTLHILYDCVDANAIKTVKNFSKSDCVYFCYGAYVGFKKSHACNNIVEKFVASLLFSSGYLSLLKLNDARAQSSISLNSLLFPFLGLSCAVVFFAPSSFRPLSLFSSFSASHQHISREKTVLSA